MRSIECLCPDHVAARRIQQDQLTRTHQAADRNLALCHWLKARAEPIILKALRLDTSAPFQDCLRTTPDHPAAAQALTSGPPRREPTP
ncbi:hypothetical protein OG894_43045 (plasmid) [Streptomyces sp. NBC_01724]|uniref:hypothetical protein n=1 Tax=unclassified Streptomyces TaxID=2593676 RepID=UPI002E348148|nr:hypothetical protein [Streptomyces sp. NBC_01724]